MLLLATSNLLAGGGDHGEYVDLLHGLVEPILWISRTLHPIARTVRIAGQISRADQPAPQGNMIQLLDLGDVVGPALQP